MLIKHPYVFLSFYTTLFVHYASSVSATSTSTVKPQILKEVAPSKKIDNLAKKNDSLTTNGPFVGNISPPTVQLDKSMVNATVIEDNFKRLKAEKQSIFAPPDQTTEGQGTTDQLAAVTQSVTDPSTGTPSSVPREDLATEGRVDSTSTVSAVNITTIHSSPYNSNSSTVTISLSPAITTSSSTTSTTESSSTVALTTAMNQIIDKTKSTTATKVSEELPTVMTTPSNTPWISSAQTTITRQFLSHKLPQKVNEGRATVSVRKKGKEGKRGRERDSNMTEAPSSSSLKNTVQDLVPQPLIASKAVASAANGTSVEPMNRKSNRDSGGNELKGPRHTKPQAPQRLIGHKGDPGSTRECGCDRPDPNPQFQAAVSAVLTKHFGPDKEVIVPFDLKLVDLADNYDNESGVFFCSIPGTYVISAHLMSHPGSKVNARIFVNNRPVAALWADDNKNNGFYPSSSIQTISRLGFGDQVYVMLVDGGYGDSWVHANYNVFTVFLLYEDFLNP